MLSAFLSGMGFGLVENAHIARHATSRRRRPSKSREAVGVSVECLEDRRLFAGYSLSAGVLSYNGTTEATNVASYALRSDGNAYYMQNNHAFYVNLHSTGANA